MAQIATVAAITGTGKAFAVNEQGVSRELKAGDVLQKGETIRTVGDVRVELLMEDGRLMAVAPNQVLRLDENVSESDQRPTAQDSAVGAPADTADTILQALERGTDLSTELEATAAGLGGGGGADGGSSFVQLLRIVEGVDPLAYDYAYTAPDLPPDLQSDPLVEVPEVSEEPAVSVGVTVGTGIGVGGDGSGLITGDIIKGAVSTVNVVEGSGGGTRAVTFLITLDKVSSTDVTVTYTIVPGSASRPDDFNDGAITGTITIPAGYIGFSLTEYVVEDTLVEGNETFTIVLSNPVGATLVNDTATVTIIDDDLATVSLSVSPADITEAGSEVIYTATLSGATFSTDVTVTLSNGQVIIIAAGQTSGNVAFIFEPSDDVYVDPSSVNVVIDSVDAGASTGKLTVDASPATVSINDTITPVSATLTSVLVGDEDGATVTYTMTLGTAPTVAETFTFKVGGVDKTITVAAGATSGTTTVSFTESDVFVDTDNIAKPTDLAGSNNSNYEQLNLVNSATSHDVLDTTDTVTATLTTATTLIGEGGGDIVYTVTLSGGPGAIAPKTDLVFNLANGEQVTIKANETVGSVTKTYSDADITNQANIGNEFSSTQPVASGGTEYENLVTTGTTLVDVDYGVIITDLTPQADGGDVTVNENDLLATRGTGESAGSDTVPEPITQGGTFTITATDGVKTLAIGGLAVITDGVYAGNGTSGTTPLGNTLTITGYDAATGQVSYTYTLGDNEAHATAGGTNSLFEDLTVSLTDRDGDNTTGTLSVQIVDDVPQFTIVNDGADSGTVVNVSAPNVATTYVTPQLADWKFGADGAQGVPTLSGVTGAVAVNAASTSSSMVIDLKDASGNVVGKLTLNADGTDSLEVSYRKGETVFTSVAATSAQAGGPEGALLVDLGSSTDFNIIVSGSDGDASLTEFGGGRGASDDDLVNTSANGWAVKGQQGQTNEQNESIKFSFVDDANNSNGYGVGDFKFKAEGYTGGISIATITIRVYLNSTHTTYDQVTIDATSGQVLQISALDWTANAGTGNYVPGSSIYGVEIISAEPDGSFRVNGVEVGTSSDVPPPDLDYNFTLNMVDGDGDAVAQSFSVHLDGSAAGSLVVEAIAGTSGADTLTGTTGADFLIGGAGDDTLTGGAGSDTFKWSLNDTGADKITDFNLAPVASGGDVLDLSDLLTGENANAASLDAYLNFSANELGQTVITVDANAGTAGGTGQSITLESVQYSALQAIGDGSDGAILAKLLTDGNLKTDV
ncbi:retention module-containing protein [Rhodoferax sp.]|uniref:retention module-containing protein n=1 Tax=Rhodoferax sp. TaxID=50421 RepID=UPI0027251A4F|nr:retention module-containing protein [Rhodoferax sp.]MDO9144919.1 retention module-containing protein [Rhodoferax sp.]